MDLEPRHLISADDLLFVALGGPSAFDGAFGTYRWRMPADAWLDPDEVAAAVHRVESALRAGDLDGAAGAGSQRR